MSNLLNGIQGFHPEMQIAGDITTPRNVYHRPRRFRPAEYRPSGKNTAAYRSEIDRLDACESEMIEASKTARQRRGHLMHQANAEAADIDVVEADIAGLERDLARLRELRAELHAELPRLEAQEIELAAAAQRQADAYHDRLQAAEAELAARYPALAAEVAALLRLSAEIATAHAAVVRTNQQLMTLSLGPVALRPAPAVHVNARLPDLAGVAPAFDGLKVTDWPGLPFGYRALRVQP